ncbi:MAG: RCC1 repeat-containing protein [Armatimonadetes bacterium]|nr:RCC1 repeat-containing protein [Armatimonadota bacterium]
MRNRLWVPCAVASLVLGGITAGSRAFAGDPLAAWGNNYRGHLGDGTTESRSTPVAVVGPANVTAVASGEAHGLALTADGLVWAWGDNEYGQVGDGTVITRTTPVPVVGLTGVVAVAAGGFHSLALKTDGTVWAWGSNDFGQLGDGSTTDRWTPVCVSDLDSITGIAAGWKHSLAVRSDGLVLAWGDNSSRQLGDDTSVARLRPVHVAYLDGIVQVAGGWWHSLALRSDGTVWSWGANSDGQCGFIDTGAGYQPAAVPGLPPVTAIACGAAHSLALAQDGTAWAWGRNAMGQLGRGTAGTTGVSGAPPAKVLNLEGVAAIAAGYEHSVALCSDGIVRAWGRNADGELGDDTHTTRSLPVQVIGITGVTGIAAGGPSSFAWLPRADTALYVPDRSGIVMERIELKGYLSRVQDHAWVAGRRLEFRLDGSLVGSGQTNSSGLAACGYTISAGAPTRAITVSFAGDAANNASSGSAILNAQVVATKVYVVDRTAKIKGYTVLKVYLFLVTNEPLPGKSVSVRVDGTSIGTLSSNAAGYVQFGYTVPEGPGAGPRTVTGQFDGTDGYMRSSGSGILTVTQGDLYIWPYIRTGKAGTGHMLKAYVRSLPDYKTQPGKAVAFKVDGSDVGTAVVASDGWASVTWAIPASEPAGAHTATCEFAGDAWYRPVAVNSQFNVVP